jgi:hypothetical protein
MYRYLFGVLLASLTGAILFVSCGSPSKNTDQRASTNTAVENANAARTNVEELSLLVNVPYQVEDIIWKENAAHKKLTAVFRFSPEDSAKLVADASLRGAPQNVTLTAATWYPAELNAQSDMSGGDSLRGIAYPADAFFQEPYTTGRIVRVEGTDYFVLELSAK